MKNNLYNTVIKNGYDVRSGVLAALDDSISMELDEFGQYQYTNMEVLKSNPNLLKLSAMADGQLNETDIAKKLFSNNPKAKYDNEVGYYVNLYAGHVEKGSYRKNGSSGGFGSWIAVQLLEKGLVDGIIHVKEADDDDGIMFKYTISHTKKEITDRAKSRYYPVELSDTLKNIKLDKKRYAVTGIPSIIMELRLLAEHDSSFAKKIKYTIGLVTGHQKSTKYTEALAWEQGIKPGDLVKINYRKKVLDKPVNQYNTEYTGYRNGKLETFTAESGKSFAGDWGRGFFKTQLSDFTDDTFNETADVVLGDAWLEEYKHESMGTNIVIVRNQDIADIIKADIESKDLKVDEIDAETIKRSQRGLIHHTRNELPYRLHKKDKAGKWRPQKRYQDYKGLPFIRKRVQDLREKMATESHIHFQEAVKRDDWNYFVKKMTPYTKQYKLLYRLARLQGKKPSWVIKKIYKKIVH